MSETSRANDLASEIEGWVDDAKKGVKNALPFLVIAAGDNEGRRSASFLEGPDGFSSSPNSRILALNEWLAEEDPLADSLASDRPVALLGIELATRRRDRLHERLTATTKLRKLSGALRCRGTGRFELLDQPQK
ncbi:hypothetical protein LVO79_10650 [Roseivivax marinus]|uniref:hypothetical protein n=1 Tax=Roseivivax marinus TaxID=1379903 RepID=UPI001F044120|nr:hypothetical protein [Roseivivax marinus]UMA63508.1 hypothetical protein LVO79_10650 [Roseivivax marinus]